MPASTTIISSPKRSSVQFIPNSPMPPRGMISKTLDTYNCYSTLLTGSPSIARQVWHEPSSTVSLKSEPPVVAGGLTANERGVDKGQAFSRIAVDGAECAQCKSLGQRPSRSRSIRYAPTRRPTTDSSLGADVVLWFWLLSSDKNSFIKRVGVLSGIS
jgi:hypothetical protein